MAAYRMAANPAELVSVLAHLDTWGVEMTSISTEEGGYVVVLDRALAAADASHLELTEVD